MIKHIVMWTLLDNAEGNNKTENAKMLKIKLEALPSQIPVIKYFEVGINNPKTSGNFDVVLISHFNSWQDLDTYINHPIHKELGSFVSKIRKDRAVVDFEKSE